MTVTIIFKGNNGATHTGQAFQVVNWEAHSAFGFLELDFSDGSSQHFNLNDIFSFQVTPAPVVSAKKPK